ncbi:hypothetical protein Ancab_021629 [Ancistrocladus abbreviatus]
MAEEASAIREDKMHVDFQFLTVPSCSNITPVNHDSIVHLDNDSSCTWISYTVLHITQKSNGLLKPDIILLNIIAASMVTAAVTSGRTGMPDVHKVSNMHSHKMIYHPVLGLQKPAKENNIEQSSTTANDTCITNSLGLS